MKFVKITCTLAGLLLLTNATHYNKNESLICRLELSTTKSKRFGQLISISGIVENRSHRKLYFEAMRSLHFAVLKKEGDGFIDFEEGWFSLEMIDPLWDEMANEINKSKIEKPVYDKQLMDSLENIIYLKNLNLSTSVDQKNEIRHWGAPPWSVSH